MQTYRMSEGYVYQSRTSRPRKPPEEVLVTTSDCDKAVFHSTYTMEGLLFVVFDDPSSPYFYLQLRQNVAVVKDGRPEAEYVKRVNHEARREEARTVLEHGMRWANNTLCEINANHAHLFPEVRNSLVRSITHLAGAMQAMRFPNKTDDSEKIPKKDD